MILSLRPYDPDRDADAVFALYAACLGSSWPLRPGQLHSTLTGGRDYRAGDHAVAIKDGEIAGFVATQVRRADSPDRPQGGIALLLVHPDHRRQGIGRALHGAAMDRLCETGMARAQLGAGTSARLWNGVPKDLPGAVAFFEACGWTFTETAHDLARSLCDYVTPAYVRQRIESLGLRIGPAVEDDLEGILAFERKAFPNWHPYFQETAETGRPDDIIAAWNPDGELVGTLLVFSADSPGVERDRIWTGLLGDTMGGLGAVGVAERERGRGIGLALVAVASEILKARGVENSHIGWTWLLDFYGRLGYTPWRSYAMAWRDIRQLGN